MSRRHRPSSSSVYGRSGSGDCSDLPAAQPDPSSTLWRKPVCKLRGQEQDQRERRTLKTNVSVRLRFCSTITAVAKRVPAKIVVEMVDSLMG